MKKSLIILIAVVILISLFPLQAAFAANTLTGLEFIVPQGYTLSPSFSPGIYKYMLTTAAEWMKITPYYQGADDGVMICNPNDECLAYLSSGETSEQIQIKDLTYFNYGRKYTADMDFLMVEVERSDGKYDVYLITLRHEYVAGGDSSGSSKDSGSNTSQSVPDTSAQDDLADSSDETLTIFAYGGVSIDYNSVLSDAEMQRLEELINLFRDYIEVDFVIMISSRPQMSKSEADEFYHENAMGIGENQTGILCQWNPYDGSFSIFTYGDMLAYMGQTDLQWLIDNATLYFDADKTVGGFEWIMDTVITTITDSRYNNEQGAAGQTTVPKTTDGTRVFDETGVLSASDTEELEERILQFQGQTGCDFAVVVLARPVSDYQAVADALWEEQALGLGVNRSGAVAILNLCGDDYFNVFCYGNVQRIGDSFIRGYVQTSSEKFDGGNYAGGFSSMMNMISVNALALLSIE